MGASDILKLPMTHFPQPHPSRRAARVQLGDSVLAAIRLEDGRRTKAKLQAISATGGLLRMSQSLGQGDFVEVAFQTQAGPVHGMAEILSPMRNSSGWRPATVSLRGDRRRRPPPSAQLSGARRGAECAWNQDECVFDLLNRLGASNELIGDFKAN